ncbi:zinc finger Y-chromosomal protein 2-like [Anoplophora glabripennis]|uniref:zinc finger Y-chromosomal protein 2-like n=1 Tax=Anoplophora glabripennis TaxID=217634 RepID=UPI00087479F3|nr:zinc finger Y-chromosomal protein 2-like [Anoplophora glabripennis]
MEFSIKEEYVDIKSEDEEKSNTLLQSSDIGPYDKSDCKHENRPANKCNTKSKKDRKVSYKCDKCIYKTRSESCFTAHRARHENDSEVYKCESCKYETQNKKQYQRHQLRHRNPSKIHMHQCQSCNYKTKRRCELAKHQVKHKSAFAGQLYECDFCDFKTKVRVSFNNHCIKHKNSNKYDEYDCKTKYNSLAHKDASQLPIYKCEDCNYKSKNKRLLIKHQLVHKDPSQHHLKHKHPSQIQMYRCNTVITKLNTKTILKSTN